MSDKRQVLVTRRFFLHGSLQQLLLWPSTLRSQNVIGFPW